MEEGDDTSIIPDAEARGWRNEGQLGLRGETLVSKIKTTTKSGGWDGSISG